MKNRSEALQVPNFTPQAARSAGEVVVSLSRGVPANGESSQAIHRRVARSVRDLGWTGRIPLEVVGSSVTPARTGGSGRPYRWDAVTGTILTPNGEVAAENIGEDRIQPVVDKFVLLDFLKAMARQNPGTVTLDPVRDIYAAGERLRFDAPETGYANMLVFNLANTGEVQALDVQVAGTGSQAFKLSDMEIVKPFGADHLVAIATNEPIDAIAAVLAGNDATPDTLLQALLTRLDGKEASVAIQPLYTRERR
ncbi:hypothetical protein [Sinorhizobium sp. BG8]|uniref:hypothetical protein n=1 Tax=Sinorhizobium sp. BG8 TaxID=2613773 RepID=UPI00193D908A|nr:hypothetical protein [Sinorhizobium sp. BG8]QRM55462.1 hypothetical protein F3Y30_13695 [Sinorhizobium sp. BG8]